MRFTYNVWHYVTQVCAVCKRGFRAVRNAFKKKNCGASPDKAKYNIKIWGELKDGNIVIRHISEPCS